MANERVSMDDNKEKAKRNLIWQQKAVNSFRTIAMISGVTYTLENYGLLDKAKSLLPNKGDAILDLIGGGLIDYTMNVGVKIQEMMQGSPYAFGAAVIASAGISLVTTPHPKLEQLDVDLRGARHYSSLGFNSINSMSSLINHQEKLFVAMANDKIMSETLLGFADKTILKNKPFRALMDKIPVLSEYIGKQKGSYQNQQKLAEIRLVSARFMGDIQSCPGAIGDALRKLPMFTGKDVKAYMHHSKKFNSLITDSIFTNAELISIMKDTLKIDKGGLFDIDPDDPLSIGKKVAIESVLVETALNLGRELDRFNTINAFAIVMTELHRNIQNGNQMLKNPTQMLADFDKLVFMSEKFKHEPEFAKIHKISTGVFNKLKPYLAGERLFIYHPRDLLDRAGHEMLAHPSIIGNITPTDIFSHILDSVSPDEMDLSLGMNPIRPEYVNELQTLMLTSYKKSVDAMLYARVRNQMEMVGRTNKSPTSYSVRLNIVMNNLNINDLVTTQQRHEIKTMEQLCGVLSSSHDANLLAVSNQMYIDKGEEIPESKYSTTGKPIHKIDIEEKEEKVLGQRAYFR